MGRKNIPHTNGQGGFSQVPREMQRSKAFHSLTASAMHVLLWAIFKRYNAASTRLKVEAGNPRFRLTNAEAKAELGLTAQTFSRAKKELQKKGFLDWAVRGGLKGCNGVASEFVLTDKWKDWIPPEKLKPTMKEARSALGKRQNEISRASEKPYPHGKNLKVSSNVDRSETESCQDALTG